jgi:hypothetical protein
MNDGPVKRRRWFRFSLRVLLIVVTVLCVWLGIQVNAARRQKNALEAILKAGSTVGFDYQVTPPPTGFPVGDIDTQIEAPHTVPVWLRQIFGEDFFRTVVMCNLDSKAISLADFTEIANLPNLKAVGLRDVIILSEDGGVNRAIQDSDLTVLHQLGQLEVLGINRSVADGSGLAKLANPSGLKLLFFDGNPISDVGAEEIGKLLSLEYLSLIEARVKDNQLKHFRTLMRLKYLSLRSTVISDAGLVYLKTLRNLATLDLARTQVTSSGIRELQKALPNCKITGP